MRTMKRWLDDLPRPKLMPNAWRKCAVQRARRSAIPTSMFAPETHDKRQFLVDVSTIYHHDAQTGIQRVVHGELNRLAQHPPEGFDVRYVAASRSSFYRYVDWPKTGAPSHIRQEVEARAGDVFYGLDLAAHIGPAHLSRLIEWKRCGVGFCFVVYDLIPLQNPAWFSGKLVSAFRRWIKAVAILADEVKCISTSVQADFRKKMCDEFGLLDDDIRVSGMAIEEIVHAAHRSKGLPSDFDTLLKTIAARKCLLMVGTLEPRKGHNEVLQAFDLLWQQGLDAGLVIVGRPGWKTEGLQRKIRRHPEHDRRLFWRDDLSDEALDGIYRASHGVMVASHAEGLGLPLLEAIRHGRPVLYRDLPVFQVVLGGRNEECASFPCAATVDELASHISRFLLSGQGFAETISTSAVSPVCDLVASPNLEPVAPSLIGSECTGKG
jgi:glycosyltransferase involved in cell wall biosynthesis